jgi:hypothetical protein
MATGDTGGRRHHAGLPHGHQFFSPNRCRAEPSRGWDAIFEPKPNGLCFPFLRSVRSHHSGGVVPVLLGGLFAPNKRPTLVVPTTGL